MSHFAFYLLLLLLTLTPDRALFAAEPVKNPEIVELIHFVETSSVRFIRNRTEHSAKEGADHLRLKLSKAGNRVRTAEDFITGVASKSYLSGQPYTVKFSDGHTQPAGDWLREHLAETRKTAR